LSSAKVALWVEEASRAWYQRFATYIRKLGFVPSVSDTSLFVYKDGASTAYLLLYVDDIVLTASSTDLLLSIIGRLHAEFAMTDLGDLHHFLGISVTHTSDGLFLSQVSATVCLGSTTACRYERVPLYLDAS